MSGRTWESKTEYQQLSTVEGQAVPTTRWDSFPGRCRVALESNGPGGDNVLIRTAGNALQAVSRQAMLQKNMLIVTVPEHCKPGDEILVKCGTDSDRTIGATIPPGALPGHSFLVSMPPPPEATVVVEDEETGGKFDDAAAPPAATAIAETPAADPSLVLVKVPPGSQVGDKIQVTLPDGRCMEAAVPQAGLTEFYMRAPTSVAAAVPTASSSGPPPANAFANALGPLR